MQPLACLTIPAGQSLSNGVDCGGVAILRIIMPDAWSGGAPLTFQMSPDGVNYHDLFHATPSTLTVYEAMLPTVMPGSVVNMPPGTGVGVGWIRLRSGIRTVPMVQEADRSFQFVLASQQEKTPFAVQPRLRRARNSKLSPGAASG
jgi:hypothetical protein